MRLFIDECLSPQIARNLNESGKHVAQHPLDFGGRGAPDHRVVERCIAHGLVIVTENARDFRALVGAKDVHPGLIIVPCVGRKRSAALPYPRRSNARVVDSSSLGTSRDAQLPPLYHQHRPATSLVLPGSRPRPRYRAIRTPRRTQPYPRCRLPRLTKRVPQHPPLTSRYPHFQRPRHRNLQFRTRRPMLRTTPCQHQHQQRCHQNPHLALLPSHSLAGARLLREDARLPANLNPQHSGQSVVVVMSSSCLFRYSSLPLESTLKSYCEHQKTTLRSVSSNPRG